MWCKLSPLFARKFEIGLDESKGEMNSILTFSKVTDAMRTPWDRSSEMGLALSPNVSS